MASLPGVPTVDEAAGLRGFDIFAFQALLVPKATSDEAVTRLSTEMAAVLRDEAVRGRMISTGIQPLDGSIAEYERVVREDRKTWVPLIRSLGISLDA